MARSNHVQVKSGLTTLKPSSATVNLMVKKNKASRAKKARTKQAIGRQPHESKDEARKKLARASGFGSDARIAKLLPPGKYELIRLLQKVLAELVKDHPQKGLKHSPVALHYAGLINALAGEDRAGGDYSPEADDYAPADPGEQRMRKQSNLAAEVLRQLVIDAVETPLAMLPSLLADNSLNDQEKLKRISVYTRSLEMLYEPLQLEPVGEPGDGAIFDARLHESAQDIPIGEACVIKRIGFTKGDTVIRKAVVEGKE